MTGALRGLRLASAAANDFMATVVTYDCARGGRAGSHLSSPRSLQLACAEVQQRLRVIGRVRDWEQNVPVFAVLGSLHYSALLF